jgi:hypothetical protein
MYWTSINDELRKGAHTPGWLLTLAILVLLGGCATTPNGEDAEDELGPGECPSWKIAVIINERIVCVDEDILDREREIVYDEDRW